MVGDEAYYRKRFAKAMDEHDVLCPYSALEDADPGGTNSESHPAFRATAIARERFIDQLIAELGL